MILKSTCQVFDSQANTLRELSNTDISLQDS